MSNRWTARVATGTVLAAAALALWAANTTPASGTLSDSSGPQSFNTAAFSSSNQNTTATAAALTCAAGAQNPTRCDAYTLNLSVSDDLREASPKALRFEISWDTEGANSGTDYDIFLVAKTSGDTPANGAADCQNNTQLGSSAKSTDSNLAINTEEFDVRLSDLPNGGYRACIVPFSGGQGQVVNGSLSLVDSTEEPPPPTGACITPFLPSPASTAPTSIDLRMGSLLKQKAASTPLGAYVYFSSGTRAEQDALLARAGLHIARDFRRYSTGVFVTGPVAGLRQLIGQPQISAIKENRRIRYFNKTNGWTTRARVASEFVSGGPYYAPGSTTPLTGAGQTVVIADSGLNALQGDFADRLIHNYKAAGDPIFTNEVQWNDAGETNTDTTSGHGTHVTGTAVGSGVRSTAAYPVAEAAPTIRGTFTGAAPGANVTVYSVGEVAEPVGVAPVGALIFIDAALADLLDNLDDPAYEDAPPRVVSLSLGDGGGTPYNASDVTSCLNKALVAAGLNVVWAAGNDGGDGSADATSSTCKDPTPGVICVASYDDLDTGTRKSILSDFSGRGAIATPKNYPDITAPGSNITSTCLQGLQGQITCTSGETRWQPGYGTISGTSMATPHVSGTIALLRQAKPDLTPAEVEKLLQDTARKVDSNGPYVPDPQNPGGTTNFGFGAGLLDIQAALDQLGIAHAGLPPLGAEFTVLDGDADTLADGAADVTKLSLQEQTRSGTTGILYRITVRDAADFATSTAYTLTVEQNVDGESFPVSLLATEAGVSSEDGTAARTANVLSLFVPYTSLGSPPLKAPIHNIRVVVTDDTGSETDQAPSPANTPAATAQLQPAYGRAFTVQTPAMSLPVDLGDPCVLPGRTQATDAAGDYDSAIGPGVPELDLTQAWIAQPYVASGSVKMVFKIKVGQMQTLAPGYGWFMSFKSPDGVIRGVRMEIGNDNMPTYFTYVAGESGGTPPVTDGRFVDTQATAEGSYTPEGEITITATAEAVGLMNPGEQLTDLNAGTVRNAAGFITEVVDAMPNGLARTGSYTYLNNAVCAPNQAPTALLSSPTAIGTPPKLRGKAPLSVMLNYDGTDGDGLVTGYLLAFGDGSTSLNETSAGSTMHTYSTPATYTATLIVTDNQGKASAPANLLIEVLGNAAPVARLSISPESGTAPLEVLLDGSASADDAADGENDAIVEYTFNFGDGTPTVTQNTATIRHPYTEAGSKTLSLTVKDAAGQVSAVVSKTLTVSSGGTTGSTTGGTTGGGSTGSGSGGGTGSGGGITGHGTRDGGSLGFLLLLPLLLSTLRRQRRV